MYRIVTQSAEDTITMAYQIGCQLTGGMTILLEGDLGSGKTTFVKGIARGLAIKRTVKSPTYTIIREYTDGRLPLYHMDLYRIASSDVEALGLYDYFQSSGVSLIEWASVAMDEMPSEHLVIQLTRTTRNDERVISITPNGKVYSEWLQQMTWE